MGEIILAAALVACCGMFYSLSNRALGIWESKVATNALPNPETTLGPMPADIRLICDRSTQAWVREDMHMHVRELAAEHQDWNKVRSILMAEGTVG